MYQKKVNLAISSEVFLEGGQLICNNLNAKYLPTESWTQLAKWYILFTWISIAQFHPFDHSSVSVN